MRAPALPAAFLALLTVAVSAATPPGLSAQDAWIRATPGVDVAAAYLTLHNAAAQAVVVSGVRSPAAAAAMIHESTLVDGKSTMRPREPLLDLTLNGRKTIVRGDVIERCILAGHALSRR